jgi:NTE family protein
LNDRARQIHYHTHPDAVAEGEQPPTTSPGPDVIRGFDSSSRPVMAARRVYPRHLIGLVLTVMLMGCASLTLVDTAPLPDERLRPPGSESISAGGYRMDRMGASADLPDLMVLVAMSGGGKRSAAFAYGALQGMRDVRFVTAAGEKSLLGELDGISGVSGGSFTAAYYGLYRDAMFGRYEREFLYADTNAYIYGIYLLPWNWGWIFNPMVGTNDYMERVYDQNLFHGATFADMDARGKPLIAIGATDISHGGPFLFTQEFFDLICSDLSRFPVARAVAASNAFPGLFSPVTLTSRTAHCGGREPAWLARVTETERSDPLSRIGMLATMDAKYLDPGRTRYVHLADGGISDNLALRAGGLMMQRLAQSPREILLRDYRHLRRVLLLSIDGQGAQDETVSQRRVVGGLISLFGLVSGAQVDRYNFETLNTVMMQTSQIGAALRDARCSLGREVDGAKCDDVRTELIHVSLAGLADSQEKSRLLAIPTGLTLKREDIDALIEAGRSAVTGSRRLREFLDSYPPASRGNARAGDRSPRYRTWR